MGTAAVHRTERNEFAPVWVRADAPVRCRTARIYHFPVRPPSMRPPSVRPTVGRAESRRLASPPVSCAHRTSPSRPSLTTAVWQTVITVVLTATALIAILGVAYLRTSEVAAGVPRTDIAVVRVGETLADVAVRIAPGADSAQVVEQIAELNVLSGTTVRPGQQLVVPVIGHG